MNCRPFIWVELVIITDILGYIEAMHFRLGSSLRIIHQLFDPKA